MSLIDKFRKNKSRYSKTEEKARKEAQKEYTEFKKMEYEKRGMPQPTDPVEASRPERKRIKLEEQKQKRYEERIKRKREQELQKLEREKTRLSSKLEKEREKQKLSDIKGKAKQAGQERALKEYEKRKEKDVYEKTLAKYEKGTISEQLVSGVKKAGSGLAKNISDAQSDKKPKSGYKKKSSQTSRKGQSFTITVNDKGANVRSSPKKKKRPPKPPEPREWGPDFSGL